MKVDKITYTQEELEISGATLLSIEEAESLPLHLLEHDNGWWWLRSPSKVPNCVTTVFDDGTINYLGCDVRNQYFLRPALQISNLRSWKIGDRFRFGNVEFEIISNDIAFCTTDIGRCEFGEVNYITFDANDYETSEAKKHIDAWFFLFG